MQNNEYHCYYSSPLGQILLTSDGLALTGLYLDGHRGGKVFAEPSEPLNLFNEVTAQLKAYFAGKLRVFDLPLDPRGTPFQMRVWQALLDIPCGETASYGEIAQAIGQPTACRAVGAANGRNPISIIIPCHRVIGTNGTMTGYGGGIGRKEWLLEHEGRFQRLENPELTQRSAPVSVPS